jgi:hypothetical protein
MNQSDARAEVEFAAHDKTRDYAALSRWEAKVAAIVDPAPDAVERNALEVFANLNAGRFIVATVTPTCRRR